MKKQVAIGNDHTGITLKNEICKSLQVKGYLTTNYGTNIESPVDYPDVAHPVADSVNSGKVDFGILICGSGQGVAIVANKHKNVRATVCWNKDIAVLARKHNDSNIICLPARFLGIDEALSIVEIFFDTEFEEGRHLKRIEKIEIRD